MFKWLIKIFFFLALVLAVFFAVFSYKIFSTGQKMFLQDNKETSLIRQFGELIFNPAEKLKGEENDRINILLLGIGGEGHSGGDLTDTIMIASIKPKEREAALLSIPRDLYVQIPDTNINNKINAVKIWGDKSKEKNGASLIKQVVKEVSGLDINYYVELDFNGFIKIVDDLGGIDIFLENDINDPAYPDSSHGYDPFYISRGWHHLDGDIALKVARSRHSKMGDFDRIERQQAIIKAVRQKVFEKYSQFDIMTFAKIFDSLGGSLKTDMQLKELPRFYKIAGEIKNHKITATTIDTKNYLSRNYVGLGYTLQIKPSSGEEIKSLPENIFKIDISEDRKKLLEKENAGIEIRNGTSTLDLANKVAADLEELGLRIINSTNILESDFSGVQIYDNPKNIKPETVKYLREKFSANIVAIPDGDSTRADFVVILGKGF